MKTLYWLAALLLMLAFTACTTAASVPSPSGVDMAQAPTSALPGELLAELSTFYRTSPLDRPGDPTAILLPLIGTEDAAALSDADLSRWISEAASPVTLTGEAFLVMRTVRGAVISVPDYGLYLCDTASCIMLTEWNRSLTDLDVYTAGDDIGVLYRQLYGTDAEIAHFIRANMTDGVFWSSLETETWWLNALDAEVGVSEDMQTLTVIGQATFTSDIIDAGPAAAAPQMALTWTYDEGEARYRPAPDPTSYETRQQFIEAAMLPSPFISLVSFLERLSTGDSELAGEMTTTPEVVQIGIDYGLYISGRHYQVRSFNAADRTLTFGDLQGQFVADFSPPEEVGGPWLINAIRPLGAVGESPP